MPCLQLLLFRHPSEESSSGGEGDPWTAFLASPKTSLKISVGKRKKTNFASATMRGISRELPPDVKGPFPFYPGDFPFHTPWSLQNFSVSPSDPKDTPAPPSWEGQALWVVITLTPGHHACLLSSSYFTHLL